MQRRTFLQCGLGAVLTPSLMAAAEQDGFDAAGAILLDAVSERKLDAAALFVRQGKTEFTRSFGKAKSVDDVFLLASISKPISVAALMTLYDPRHSFALDDKVARFIPEFKDGGRGQITIRQLLTHVSGLPDQLPENQSLRRRHAALDEFVALAIRTPLLFEPGSQYKYSSMGILLAGEIARRISGKPFPMLVDEAVFRPLEMRHSAVGLGRFKLEETVRCQVEKAAPESGAGDPSAKEWDWNSRYWRNLGSPWGGIHGSAPDVARFLAAFLHPAGKLFSDETARLMVQNHNRAPLASRGLGFDVGAKAGSAGCSNATFGHSGSTGTLAWADPATDTICVVLTTLPWRGAEQHPGRIAAERVARSSAS